MSDPAKVAASPRDRDHRAGWLVLGFLVLLLASEAALTLPDERATDAAVAIFYAAHRPVIIGLQGAGFVAAGLLGAYAWRLRHVDIAISRAGLALALVSVTPGLLTAVTAVMADPEHPARTGSLNRLEPRADDALFVCVLIFSGVVLLRTVRHHRWLGALAAITAASCIVRLVLEVTATSAGPAGSVAPICFLLLTGFLGVLSFRGLLTSAPRTPPGVRAETSTGRRAFGR